MSHFVIKNGVLKKHTRNCRDVVIPDSVTSIGHHAFNCCISLKSIIIPESVTSIEYNAFFMCQNLKSIVTINEQLKKMHKK